MQLESVSQGRTFSLRPTPSPYLVVLTHSHSLPPSAGKSTVLKQMKLIHHGCVYNRSPPAESASTHARPKDGPLISNPDRVRSYKDTERGGYREIVFSNTIQSYVQRVLRVCLLYRHYSPLASLILSRGGSNATLFLVFRMRVLLEALQTMSIPVSQVNRGYQAAIMAAPSQIESDTMPAELAQAVQALWEDAGVRKGYERRNEMQLNDSAE